MVSVTNKAIQIGRCTAWLITLADKRHLLGARKMIGELPMKDGDQKANTADTLNPCQPQNVKGIGLTEMGITFIRFGRDINALFAVEILIIQIIAHHVVQEWRLKNDHRKSD